MFITDLGIFKPLLINYSVFAVILLGFMIFFFYSKNSPGRKKKSATTSKVQSKGAVKYLEPINNRYKVQEIVSHICNGRNSFICAEFKY